MDGGEVVFNTSKSSGANVTREVDRSCARTSSEEKMRAKVGFLMALGVRVMQVHSSHSMSSRMPEASEGILESGTVWDRAQMDGVDLDIINRAVRRCQ